MDHDLEQLIAEFLAAPVFAVAGASDDPEKYGHKCFAALLRRNRRAYPVNPRAKTVLGHIAYPNLLALPEKVVSISIVTPPAVTEKVVADALATGAQVVWMQPGAESPAAIAAAQRGGLKVIAGGPCLLVTLARGA